MSNSIKKNEREEMEKMKFEKNRGQFEHFIEENEDFNIW
jgi:hypothetical protein